ncbi:ATP-binding cassette domain-containing protein, partial [Leucobacter sp. M11]|uniref:ATP-binding cassette domain-containing protein n=1 Tax=Leucobacter sp. M11 TaxID=2993565 RepID=UPI002D7F7D16
RFLAKDALGLLGALDPELPVDRLPLGQRQRLEIALVLWRGARVLVLDEPTALLLPAEAMALEDAVRGLADAGVAVLWVTHELRQARRIGDRLTVLRAGRVALALDRAGLAALGENAGDAAILDAMFGPPEPAAVPGNPAATPPVPERAAPVHVAQLPGRQAALELRDVDGPAAAGEIAVAGLSLTVAAGEILGVAGVDGQGQRSLFDAVSGLRRVRAGRVHLAGSDVTRLGIGARRGRGLGALSDDRLGEGIAGSLSVTENLTMTRIARPPFWRRGLARRDRMRAAAEAAIAEYRIRPGDPLARAAALSGGNIQKLLLARELAGEPTLLLCHQPSHGLDVRTVALVHERLRAAAAAGAGVLLLSSDLAELTALSDRILVLSGGRAAAEVAPAAPDAAERIREAMVIRP